MSEKIPLVICLGSSCFARGNKNTLKVITQYLKTHNLQDKVAFKGGHCFGRCAEGPILQVGNEMYSAVDEFKAIEILTNHFEG
jgi:NADH:ubiquinone oxidoreductase subunit E